MPLKIKRIPCCWTTTVWRRHIIPRHQRCEPRNAWAVLIFHSPPCITAPGGGFHKRAHPQISAHAANRTLQDLQFGRRKLSQTWELFCVFLGHPILRFTSVTYMFMYDSRFAFVSADLQTTQRTTPSATKSVFFLINFFQSVGFWPRSCRPSRSCPILIGSMSVYWLNHCLCRTKLALHLTEITYKHMSY